MQCFQAAFSFDMTSNFLTLIRCNRDNRYPGTVGK